MGETTIVEATTLVGDRCKGGRAANQELHILRRVYPAPLGAADTVRLHRTVAICMGRSADLRSVLLGELRVDDPGCSRRHAKLGWSGALSAFVLEDLSSANGTFVDGVRIQSPTPLRDGMVVRMGDSLFVMVHISAPANIVPEMFKPGISISRAIAEYQSTRLAKADLNVLVTGETGVGKERLCAHLHDQSGRRGKFVAVNCATLVGDRAKADLFGHLKGAYTGATGAGRGFFLAADHGTLFLDEIGELSLPVQSMLLRVLTEGAIRPYGDTSATPVQIQTRVVTATHRDLDQMVASGTFRQDLLARLREAVLPLPALRMRRDEILTLFRGFLPVGMGLCVAAAQRLLSTEWPENVRGLKSAAKRALAFAEGEVTVNDLPQSVRVHSKSPTRQRGIKTPSRAELVAACVSAEGNVAELARMFGKGRQQIWRWLKKWEIDIDAYRG